MKSVNSRDVESTVSDHLPMMNNTAPIVNSDACLIHIVERRAQAAGMGDGDRIARGGNRKFFILLKELRVQFEM